LPSRCRRSAGDGGGTPGAARGIGTMPSGIAADIGSDTGIGEIEAVGNASRSTLASFIGSNASAETDGGSAAIRDSDFVKSDVILADGYSMANSTASR
jgi:hypothetical protein